MTEFFNLQYKVDGEACEHNDSCRDEYICRIHTLRQQVEALEESCMELRQDNNLLMHQLGERDTMLATLAQAALKETP